MINYCCSICFDVATGLDAVQRFGAKKSSICFDFAVRWFFSHTVVFDLLNWLAACDTFHLCWGLGCWFLLFSLGEDCIPGWGIAVVLPGVAKSRQPFETGPGALALESEMENKSFVFWL